MQGVVDSSSKFNMLSNSSGSSRIQMINRVGADKHMSSKIFQLGDSNLKYSLEFQLKVALLWLTEEPPLSMRKALCTLHTF